MVVLVECILSVWESRLIRVSKWLLFVSVLGIGGCAVRGRPPLILTTGKQEKHTSTSKTIAAASLARYLPLFYLSMLHVPSFKIHGSYDGATGSSDMATWPSPRRKASTRRSRPGARCSAASMGIPTRTPV